MPSNESIYDLVLEELKERMALVRRELAERQRRSKPFREEPVSGREALLDYDSLGDVDFQRMTEEFGVGIVGQYQERMENLRRRYQ